MKVASILSVSSVLGTRSERWNERTLRPKTPEGRSLYALRKHTPEPVFGVIKSALGFRQFSVRALNKARGEWSVVTMAWNLKRMFVLAAA